jgi:hypothetical protein
LLLVVKVELVRAGMPMVFLPSDPSLASLCPLSFLPWVAEEARPFSIKKLQAVVSLCGTLSNVWQLFTQYAVIHPVSSLLSLLLLLSDPVCR